MGDSSKLPNVAARQLYLKALHSEWPEVLEALHRDVFPRLVELWPSRLVDGRGLLSPQLTQFAEAMEDSELRWALKAWANSFLIEDKWMIATARSTLYMYGAHWEDVDEEWTGWIQSTPKHLAELVPFEMGIKALWIPPEHGGHQTWEQFSGDLTSELNSALSRYRKAQKVHYGVRRENGDRDARWTARYQKGQLAAEISKELPLAYGDPEQTVWKAIARFSKDVGLTLRPNRRRTGK